MYLYNVRHKRHNLYLCVCVCAESTSESRCFRFSITMYFTNVIICTYVCVCVQNLPLSRDVLDLPLNQVTPQNVVIKLRKGEC